MSTPELLIYLVVTLVLNQVVVLMRTNKLKDECEQAKKDALRHLADLNYEIEKCRRTTRELDNLNTRVHQAYAQEQYKQTGMKS